MERSHPPLRRVTRGDPMRVDPSLKNREVPNREVSLNSREVPLNSPTSRVDHPPKPAVSERDSCYSSCSEESHSSLSRESSDALGSDLNMDNLKIDDSLEAVTPTTGVPLELVAFARTLGYSEDQLMMVLSRVGCDAGQDRVLAELVKLGRGCEGGASRSQQREDVHGGGVEPLRSIVIDGSNIAMTHGRKEVFSCAGIKDCVQFFTDRGHRDVLVFIPQFRKEAARSDCPITDQHLLNELDSQGRIVWTPSRRINGRRIVCHDDRYILKTADEKEAVVVSNDEYRDLVRESPQYLKLVENRLLMYSFVDGKFMPPDDPLGRHGPKLDQFLAKHQTTHGAQLCPYARKCTYGNKCKYFHPERPNGVHVSVTERLMKEKNMKRPVTSRPSMQYELLKSSHLPVARTQSLHAQLEGGNQENTPIGTPRPLHLPVQSWHSTIGRNQSVPIPSRNNEPEEMGHLYAPSTAVWGHSELSVGPLVSNGQPCGTTRDQMRARLHYNLCQLFPEAVVCAVMSAHPDETSSQVLCERIIAMERGFCRGQN